MLTKTSAKILEVFVAKIISNFTIKQVSEIFRKPYPLIHRSIKDLLKKNFLLKSQHNFSLNYKSNHSELSYIESLRRGEFLGKNKTVALLAKDVVEKIGIDFFVLIIFGSYARGSKTPRDIDILLIIEDKNEIGKTEKILGNIASNFSVKSDINVISTESVYEMLSKRDEANVMNETLDNHIILFGAENYYRLLKNARR